jgi:hypothetical protein
MLNPERTGACPVRNQDSWRDDGWQDSVFLGNEIRHPYSGAGTDEVVLLSVENRVG